jgi:hypothetical protein
MLSDVPTPYAIALSMTREPAEALAALRDTAAACGAVIVESTRFSNKALSLHVECYAKDVKTLVEALAQIGSVHHAGESQGEAPLASLPTEGEVLILLHVSLVHDQPDERIALPKVPG